jgi:dipeptidyl aminopeptidase/acylaminoacyl peptidase
MRRGAIVTAPSRTRSGGGALPTRAGVAPVRTGVAPLPAGEARVPAGRAASLGVAVVAAAWLAALPWAQPAQCRAAIAAAASIAAEGIPEIPDSVAARMEQYNNTRSATLEGWLPDGAGILIGTRFAETRQLHIVQMPGGARQQVTFFGEPVAGAAVSPAVESAAFAFTMDKGGDEEYQLYLFDLRARRTRQLTQRPGRSGGLLWSRAGNALAFQSTLRNGHDFDIRIVEPRTGAASRVLLQGEGRWTPVEWSPDDRQLLVKHLISESSSQLWIVDVATGDKQPLQQLAQPVAYGDAVFDASGKGVYFVCDSGGELRRLAHLRVGGAAPRVLTADLPWDVEEVALSVDGRWLAFTANVNGASDLYLMDTRSGRRHHIDLPTGVVSGLQFEPAGTRLGLVLNTPSTPGDVFSLDLQGGKPAAALVRWTLSEVGGLDPNGFVEPERVEFPTFDVVDGAPRKLAAFYFHPAGRGPHPVIVYLHGGPEDQTRPEFASHIQYWVKEQGIAVLAPNVRGSTGYGRTFQMLDDGRRREDAVRDVGALLDWIARQPELDASRVGVYGGSYGGYLVLAALVHYGGRIAAAVDYVGLSDFVTFLQGTHESRRDARRAEYGDERNPQMREFLDSISPLRKASQIHTPLLVAHGANDPRVPLAQAQAIVAAVRANGQEVWSLFAGDEGHGFGKQQNADYYRLAVALFWERNLLHTAPRPHAAGH